MCDLIVSGPDARLSALNVPPERPRTKCGFWRRQAVTRWGGYRRERPWNSRGIPKPVFLQRLGDYGVPVLDMTKEDFKRETRLVEPESDFKGVFHARSDRIGSRGAAHGLERAAGS